jgi:hypothetical protein
MEYWHIDTGVNDEARDGGLMKRQHPQQGITNYVDVPSVDTGGLPINNAVTINAYSDIASLLEGESQGGRKAALPGPGDHPSTERPSR